MSHSSTRCRGGAGESEGTPAGPGGALVADLGTDVEADPLEDWWRRAHAGAAAIAHQPARTQLVRLAEDPLLLDAVVSATALGLAQAGIRTVLASPRLVQARRASLWRVHRELAALVPRRAGPRHWAVRGLAEIRRQITDSCF